MYMYFNLLANQLKTVLFTWHTCVYCMRLSPSWYPLHGRLCVVGSQRASHGRYVLSVASVLGMVDCVLLVASVLGMFNCVLSGARVQGILSCVLLAASVLGGQ